MIERIGRGFRLGLSREEFDALQFAASLAVSSILLPTHPERGLLEDLADRMEEART